MFTNAFTNAENFIIKWIGWPILWIPGSIFPQPPLSSSNGLTNQVAMVTATEIMQGLSNMGQGHHKPRSTRQSKQFC